MNRAEVVQIDAAMDREDWSDAQRLIALGLKAMPHDHWLLTQMGTALYEQRKYCEALAWSRKAMAVAPQCPLVLWDFASALDMTGEVRQAMRVWQKLLRRGVERVAHDECGEGKRWAESLLNDCRYRLGLTYLDVGEPDKAATYLREHLAHRRPGQPSIYTRRDALAALRRTKAGADRTETLCIAEVGAR